MAGFFFIVCQADVFLLFSHLTRSAATALWKMFACFFNQPLCVSDTSTPLSFSLPSVNFTWGWELICCLFLVCVAFLSGHPSTFLLFKINNCMSLSQWLEVCFVTRNETWALVISYFGFSQLESQDLFSFSLSWFYLVTGVSRFIATHHLSCLFSFGKCSHLLTMKPQDFLLSIAARHSLDAKKLSFLGQLVFSSNLSPVNCPDGVMSETCQQKRDRYSLKTLHMGLCFLLAGLTAERCLVGLLT